MKKRALTHFLAVVFVVSLCVTPAQGRSAGASGAAPGGAETDFRSLMEKNLAAWDTLDPAKAAPFYSQEPDRVFFDVGPMKYSGWAEYAEGVKKMIGDFASLKFTLGDDARTHRQGNLAWATATWTANVVTKQGAKQTLAGRWTVVWEKRGSDWLIVHEHVSVPLPAPADTTGQSLYKRLGGYEALAAVTDDFIGRLATDPQLSRFFVGHSTGSLKRIRQLVVDQLCEATGGPCVYTGRDMKSAHAGMGISEENWDTAVKLLVATLEKFKVPAKEKDEVLNAISGLKKDIVTSVAGGDK